MNATCDKCKATVQPEQLTLPKDDLPPDWDPNPGVLAIAVVDVSPPKPPKPPKPPNDICGQGQLWQQIVQLRFAESSQLRQDNR